jgi:hypothetical protein
MKHIVQATDNYFYHFTVTEHEDGTKTLKVESQWTGAKDPNGLQTRWQATLRNEDWVEVASLLF